jgi:hypothetical protein
MSTYTTKEGKTDFYKITPEMTDQPSPPNYCKGNVDDGVAFFHCTRCYKVWGVAWAEKHQSKSYTWNSLRLY